MPVVLAVLWLTTSLWAQQDATELAKQTQNLAADLISVPFQHNFNFGAGTKDATVYVLNVQPVIPLKLTEDWVVVRGWGETDVSQTFLQPFLAYNTKTGFGVRLQTESTYNWEAEPCKPHQSFLSAGGELTRPCLIGIGSTSQQDRTARKSCP